MNPTRRVATVTGVLFLVTEVSAIAGLALYSPVLKGTDYVLGAGADTRIFLGAMCELILALAVIGTAATLYPIIKRQHEGIALGHVCARLAEAAVIIVGIISVLAVVTLRQDMAGAAGTDAASLSTAADALIAVHDWTFVFGPGFLLGVNTTLLAYLMYRSALVPRFIAVLGLVGGPLIFLGAVAVTFGVYEQADTVGLLVALPVFAWEVTFAIRLITKGFDPSPVLISGVRPFGADPALTHP
jgi:hypothetical protein